MSPHIIRTRDVLEVLDPDVCLLDSVGETWLAHQAKFEDGSWSTTYTNDLPAVVIATGEQVRAAQQALEKEQDID